MFHLISLLRRQLLLKEKPYIEITPNFSSNHDVKSGVISLLEQVLSLGNLTFYCLTRFPLLSCFREQFLDFFLLLTSSFYI